MNGRPSQFSSPASMMIDAAAASPLLGKQGTFGGQTLLSGRSVFLNNNNRFN